MFSFKIFTVFILAGLGLINGEKIYKMCVPHIYYDDCLKILKEPSQAGILMNCVSGRDRMECLEKVNKREADVIAVEPEDMYVAYHMNNQDFHVISEIRTQVEKDAEFRYEGIILVKKSTPINKLEDLKGMKSCHTGFGRNVGYKIPITKLKNLGLLKISLDPLLSPTERELKALSTFFSKSCLVGTYSPSPEIDQSLKKKYPNLCELCEKPQQCNYPDKFSGYDGAIRCLMQGQGDVAFTKTSYVKKYFGLIGNKAEGNPEDVEYLCEDGSRKPITGPACSWAQRPWKGYMSNADNTKEKPLLERLQKRIDKFFQNGLESEDKKAATNLLIEPDLVYHEKKESIMPKEYLEKAGYKDVIERDGSVSHKIRMCVLNQVELEKCKVLKEAAYSREIRPEFECVLKADVDQCVKAVKDEEADVVILKGDKYNLGVKENLKPLIYEQLDEEKLYTAVVDADFSEDDLRRASLKYNKDDERAVLAAKFLEKHRGKRDCVDHKKQIEILKSGELAKLENKKLLCLSLEKKPLSEYKSCNIEAYFPNTVFVRDNWGVNPIKNTIHAFISLSEKFGHKGKLEDVFELFSEFKSGYKNVLFNDDGAKLSDKLEHLNGITDELFVQLKELPLDLNLKDC